MRKQIFTPHKPGRYTKKAPYWRGERAEKIVRKRVLLSHIKGKKKLRVAFTGTQRGTTGRQRRELKRRINRLIDLYGADHLVFAHGGCTGGDYEFHMDAMRAGGIFFDIWPSTNTKKDRSKMIKQRSLIKRLPPPVVKMHRPKPPLERNEDIIAGAFQLLACPKEKREVTRSGTWHTVRLARKAGRVSIRIIKP